jgi:hypothetical protein
MGRGRQSRRWIAASGGVLINGLMLAGLVLIEQAPPVIEEQPVIMLELERPQRQKAPRSRASPARAAASSPAGLSTFSREPEGEGPPAVPSPEPAPPVVDPVWRVDPKAVERWRLTEGAAEWGSGRHYRACKGLGSEHMTDEEKDRCYGGWGGAPHDGRPSPGFIGPIRPPDKIYVPSRDPPSRYDKDAARQQRCRDERRRRVPGNLNEKHLDFTGGSPAPSLLEGGCF